MPAVDPNKFRSTTALALLINNELGLPPGSPNRSTIWCRINRGVKAGDGTICFLRSARFGVKVYSTLAWWREHVIDVGLHDQIQRNREAGNDIRRRRPPAPHLSKLNPAEAGEAANLAASEAGW